MDCIDRARRAVCEKGKQGLGILRNDPIPQVGASGWNAEHLAGRITRPLRAGGQPYRGINVVMLWLAATLKGYSAPIWMSYRQAGELGGPVRKGEHGTAVAYADELRKAETDETTDEAVEREIFFMKHYTVFNVEQVDSLPPHFYATAAPQISAHARIVQAEAFFAALGAEVRHGGNRALYAMEPDHCADALGYKAWPHPSQRLLVITRSCRAGGACTPG